MATTTPAQAPETSSGTSTDDPAIRTALVTGASSGIGEDTARRLRALGYTVYGAARRTDRLRTLATDGVRPLAMDVTDDASMTAGVSRILQETGRIDVLVNNAGYGSYGAIEDVPIDEARRQFEVNLFGLARLTQLVTPHMRAQGSGTIINISSMGGKLTTPLGGWYHLEATADGSAYADQIRAVAGAMRSESNQRHYSPPMVIARTVGKIVTARRPRTRYAVGFLAKPLIAVRRVLPDRTFDRIIGTAFGFPQ